MGFSRQEYWSGLPFPSPGDLPKPGIKPASPSLTGRLLTTEPSGKHPTNRRHELMEPASLSFTGTSLTESSKVSNRSDYQLSTEEASSVTWHSSHTVSHCPTPAPLLPGINSQVNPVCPRIVSCPAFRETQIKSVFLMTTGNHEWDTLKFTVPLSRMMTIKTLLPFV